MITSLNEFKQAKAAKQFHVGDVVVCTEGMGTFAGFKGKIKSFNVATGEMHIILGLGLDIETCPEHFKYNFKLI